MFTQIGFLMQTMYSFCTEIAMCFQKQCILTALNGNYLHSLSYFNMAFVKSQKSFCALSI